MDKRAILRNIFYVVMSVLLLSCGSGESSNTNNTTTQPTPTQGSTDTWIEAKALISEYMRLRNANLNNTFRSRVDTTSQTLAAQGIYGSVLSDELKKDAEFVINLFINEVHTYVWNLASTNRIDELEMTNLMNSYNDTQNSYFENFTYPNNFRSDLLIARIKVTLNLAYNTEMLLLAQLW